MTTGRAWRLRYPITTAGKFKGVEEYWDGRETSLWRSDLTTYLFFSPVSGLLCVLEGERQSEATARKELERARMLNGVAP